MEEEGMATEGVRRIASPDWDVFYITQKDWEEIEGPIEKFFLSHNKQDLFIEGSKREIPVCPVFSPSEILDFSQLKERDFWIDVKHPELGTSIKYAGFCPKFSKTPSQVRRRPPLIGEHNLEVYHGELGLSKEDIISLKQANVI
jgi:crotonobetainyl-CoA:carnitine CoA-transferase CaiB-like acyl-CoA transferase